MTTTMVRDGTVLLEPFVDRLRVPRVIRPGTGTLRITARAARVRWHRDLPMSDVWAYEGQVPGPTIEVRRGQRLRVHWRNELRGELPITAVVAPAGSSDEPGRSGGEVRDLSGIPAWTAVHVHGAAVDGGSDGWPENGMSAGEEQVFVYPNEQRASGLWYHDHAMNLTAYQVYAGLAGMYLIRDDTEDGLGLPHGTRELPLMIKDVNLDLDDEGRATGRLLHKIEQGGNEAFGPFTSVNGRIWPYARLRPTLYRLRLLNASNARTYRLAIVDEAGVPLPAAMTLVGTDGGLLGAAAPVPHLVLAPAERADVLLDLHALGGRTLTVINTAPAPYRGQDGERRARVMQLRVEHGAFKAARIPAVLDPEFRRLTHDDLPHDHGHRLIMLVKSAKPLREMVADEPGPGITTIVGEDGTAGHYRTAAGTWTDAATIHVQQDAWEIWRILNLSGQTHPIHLHLVQFQILRRETYDASGFDPATGEADPPVRWTGTLPVPGDEAGWKDTVRVDPQQMAVVAARFAGHSGRYVYHCHLLEHEDAGMMRPFTVMPAGIPGMDGGHAH